MAGKSLSDAISAFGAATTAKLSSAAISGAQEDQLRAPLEALFAELAELAGHAPGSVTLIGETALSEDRIRPDYAITVRNALVGFVEVKAPGKGADPRKYSVPHDKRQFERLKSLPNLLYTDGNAFSLWRDGEIVGKVVKLEGDVESSGSALAAPQALVGLITDFLNWSPITPKSPRALAEVSARLCRLLRDEVEEELERKNPSFTGLAQEWRRLLFPKADDADFADGYAQAVTFGLLIARTRDISLKEGLDHAATELRKANSLIGTALRLLIDDPKNQKALETSLDTMRRVFEEVNWSAVSKDDPEAWLYFYEHFLAVYDNALRKQTGSYYTPPEVVNAMVRLVDEALRGPLFNRASGLAADDVVIADPAVGTGTFLLGVLRRIASIITFEQGAGAVAAAVQAAAKRLIGFELQFGPFAVAQLRLIAEFRELTGGKTSDPLPDLNLFVTDTLGNPYVEEENLSAMVEPLAQSRRDANRIKREQRITVVIGNPPYKEKAEGRGGWVERGSSQPGSKDIQAPLDRWRPPVEWGLSAHVKHLKNLYIYFWRWATLKVFGTGLKDATGLTEKDEEGIVCFITVAGFLNGPGFEKMRADLRASCSDIWVIDCSPEGHQPNVPTRIFQGVQQPVCIVMAARALKNDEKVPARVLYRALPEGDRKLKFAELAKLDLASGWVDGPSGWRAPFLPEATGEWAEFPKLKSFFSYDGSGVMPGRTWVIAPDRESLEARWQMLVNEPKIEKKEELFRPHLRKGKPGDKHVRKALANALAGHEARLMAVADDQGAVVAPVRYAFRTLDRQWIIPDGRLINQPNPKLWEMHSGKQVYLTAPTDRSPTNGPALTLSSAIADLHHYNGRGGRVFPLWSNAEASSSNIKADVLSKIAAHIGREVSAQEVMAYLAAVLANPAFTERFEKDLVQPGLRVPLTAVPALFDEAVKLGSEVIWLHTYGERFDNAPDRPKAPPKLPKERAPTIPAGGAIPGAPTPLPDELVYDAANQRLHVGGGYIENVTPAMMAYEVSGKEVVRQWFSYRRRDRTKPPMGDKRPPSPLDFVQPDGWLAEYTTDLINLLNVIGRPIDLEPSQANLLQRILDHPLIPVANLVRDEDDGETDSDADEGAE